MSTVKTGRRKRRKRAGGLEYADYRADAYGRMRDAQKRRYDRLCGKVHVKGGPKKTA